MSHELSGERVVVVGAGVAGLAVARALVGEEASVLLTERRSQEELGRAAGEMRSLGVELATGGHDPSHLDGADLVVTGPGVPQGAPVLSWARERGIPIWGEMELGARLCETPYVAITGTNGKTTTTGMIAACLRSDGLDGVACGNIGHPFVTAAREDHDVLVVECSSFQLAIQESFHPKVSVLLNLAPDHLDWHGSYSEYVMAKAKVFALQAPGETHIGNRDDPEAAAVSAGAPCDVAWFRLGEPAPGEVGYSSGGDLIGRIDGEVELGRVDGDRAGYRADAAAAAAVALSFGVSPEAVSKGLGGFEPEPHRGEVVLTVGGVRFVDNSKATNVHAALAAISEVPGAVLIAGGRAKGADLSPLAAAAQRLGGVVVIGEAAKDLSRVFDGLLPVRTAGSIEEAVRIAYEMSPSPGTVLLAPACASWDQFNDYAERGDRFAAAARELRVGTDVHGRA